MSTYDFTGQVALVTGAGSGIGAEIARGLAASGAFVVVTDRRLDRVETVVAGRGEQGRRRCSTRELDATDRGAFAALVESVTSEQGRVDLLVNNAGVVSVPKPLA